MTLTDIRHALQQLDAKPRQSLGQNFLHDQNLARWIVAQVRAEPADTVVEIGPGLGALTGFLAGLVARLVLLEKDAKMVESLRGRFTGSGVELFHGDALNFDLRLLWGNGPIKVVGNLPYYVSTALIAKFTDALSPASELVLTLQSEVADRLAAVAGDADFGAMSVCVQRRWHVEFLRKLPPSVFYPVPKVASAVVRLSARAPGSYPAIDEEFFESLVRRGFSERRKQLKNLLPELRDDWPALAREVGVTETARAEDLSLQQWENLTRAARPNAAQRSSEMFDVVDASDRVVEPQTRDFVHVNKLRHRAVHILLFDPTGRLFLQRRSPWKDLNPGLWDSSAAGHVDAGETYSQAAHRELAEELGVSGPLERIGKLESRPETSWEFVEIFRGPHEGPFRLARLEVETGAFFPVTQIADWLDRRPTDFSPLFRMIFPRYVLQSCVADVPRYE